MIGLALCLVCAGGLAQADADATAELRQQAKTLSTEADGHYRAGRFADADAAYRKLLAVQTKLYPKADQPEVAVTHLHLGLTQRRLGKYKAALPHALRALAIFRAVHPSEKYPAGHPDDVLSYELVGLVYGDLHDTARSEASFRAALAMSRRLHPPKRSAAGYAQQARLLDRLVGVLQERGAYPEAEACAREELALTRKLYPRESHSRGHPDLAVSLHNLGRMLHQQGRYAEAETLLREAVEQQRALYPKGDHHLALTLGTLGGTLQAQGRHAEAEALLRESVALLQRLYSPERYPQGHTNLAIMLNNLGHLLQAQGELAQAEDYFRKALAAWQQLYPPERYPQGHRQLATALNNLGFVLTRQREYGRAEPILRDALAMRRRVYPKDQFPLGHPALASDLGNLGWFFLLQRDTGKAEPFVRDALAMQRRLYPPDRYPVGHPDVARSAGNLGWLLELEGKYAEADAAYRECLAIRRQLYPALTYPLGHRNLVLALSARGRLLDAWGKSDEAQAVLREAVTMSLGLNEVLVMATSEAQALNQLAVQPRALEMYLSATRARPGQAAAAYEFVWRRRGLLARTTAARRRALLRAADDPTRDLGRRLAATRQALAALLLARSAPGPDRAERLKTLTAQKEELERQISKRLPAVAELEAQERRGPDTLAARLPAGTAFIDLTEYVRVEQDPKVPGVAGRQETNCYAAFVVRPGRPVVRVELGPSRPINRAVVAWREALARGGDGKEAQTQRRLVWEPLARHLPAKTRAVWLAPEAYLTAVPWAALPGSKPGTVLLEEHALAVVPHGAFLLEALTASRGRQPPEAGRLLAVGGVAYDSRPANGPADKAGQRAAPPGAAGLTWKALPATTAELERVLALAGRRQSSELRAEEASVARVLMELPRARWVHLATHGFFADRRFRARLQFDEKDFGIGPMGERAGAGARSPLVLSGLVLAGANLAAQDGGGVLTAEALAGLDLDGLDLAVLSACDTGLGQLGGREGVFGLQRAFHLAGCKDVVASLWKVDDEATAALMSLFYHKLWKEKLPPLEALRQAQLGLYHHPERIGRLARARGPDFDKEAELPAAPAREARAPTRLWAGFILSGAGR
jgi:CHAT domain-containing protein/tetratricopeptide (TPR) repeat protein